MRVCVKNELGRLNCGRCEKCVRTLLELKAAGLTSAAFEVEDIEPARIRHSVRYLSLHTDSCYRDVLIPLRDKGHNDLSAALSWALQRDRLRRRIKRLDQVSVRWQPRACLEGTQNRPWIEREVLSRACGQSCNAVWRT